MDLSIDVNNILGLDQKERARFQELLKHYNAHKTKNSEKNRY